MDHCGKTGRLCAGTNLSSLTLVSKTRHLCTTQSGVDFGERSLAMTTGHDVAQRSAVDQWNHEAEQILLRALDGAGGTWERHVPKTNLRDLISGAANDNNHGE